MTESDRLLCASWAMCSSKMFLHFPYQNHFPRPFLEMCTVFCLSISRKHRKRRENFTMNDQFRFSPRVFIGFAHFSTSFAMVMVSPRVFGW